MKSTQAQQASARPRQKPQFLLNRACDGISLGGKSHTISGGQDGADSQGRMKSPGFLQIKTFMASLMVHPKAELHSQCHGWELQLPWADAWPTQGSLMQHLPLESSVSSTRDLSLQGRKKPLLPLEPSDKMWSFCLRDAALPWGWVTKGRCRVHHTAWNSVLHGKCRRASLNPPTPLWGSGTELPLELVPSENLSGFA